MAALINWLLAEGQTSHLEELTGPALPGCVSANDNKDAPPALGAGARRPKQQPEPLPVWNRRGLVTSSGPYVGR